MPPLDYMMKIGKDQKNYTGELFDLVMSTHINYLNLRIICKLLLCVENQLILDSITKMMK